MAAPRRPINYNPWILVTLVTEDATIGGFVFVVESVNLITEDISGPTGR